MTKIATNQEINSKINSSLFPPNKCPTRQEIEATGKGKVSNLYKNTQLVSQEVVTLLKETVSIYFSKTDVMQIHWSSERPLASLIDVTVDYMDTSAQRQRTSYTLWKGEQSGGWSVNYDIDMLVRASISPNEDATYYYSSQIRRGVP